MHQDLFQYVTSYGYVAIFALVFLQELGVPNPVPNELVLMFSGYLCYIKVLNLFGVILTAIAADFIGTTILYFVFYFFGAAILKRKPRWLPLSEEKITHFKEKILKGGYWRIYLGRLTPFVRGYTSVFAGILNIKPATFLTTVLISAVTWSGGLSLLGWVLGPSWASVTQHTQYVEDIIMLLLLGVVIFFLGKYLARRVL